jgi:hypothetical protein
LILAPPQSVRDLILYNFGTEIRVYPKESNPSVGTTALAIGAFANVRVALTVANPGSNTVYLGYSTSVSATFGFPLAAGQFLTWNWYIDGEIVMAAMFAIAGSSSNPLYVVESSLIGA